MLYNEIVDFYSNVKITYPRKKFEDNPIKKFDFVFRRKGRKTWLYMFSVDGFSPLIKDVIKATVSGGGEYLFIDAYTGKRVSLRKVKGI